MLNPGVLIVVRAHSDEDTALLRKENAGKVYMGEHELARSMAEYVLAQVAEPLHAAHMRFRHASPSSLWSPKQL